ncbi:MAG: RluA family pseudouridine synthase [Pseudomonadota bacterium]
MAQHQTHRIILAPASPRQRLDKALASAGLELSRQRLQGLIRQGAVEVNGTAARSPSAKVGAGDVLTLVVPAAAPARIAGEAIALDILYEDAHILVLDKPAGMVVHPAPGNPAGTLVNALIAHCGPALSGIGGVARPGIVHRLDKDTSGVMVVAKSDAASQALTKAFATHSIERVYAAVLWGRPTPLIGIVDAALGRHPSARIKMAVARHGQGKPARTHYKVERSFGPAARPVASLVSCRLETGRTHQVRVHMASLGHPLIGDPVYGRRRALSLADGRPFARQALHARRLAFDHPITHERLTFESPLPNDMIQLIKYLETV